MVLDQSRLPGEELYVTLRTVAEVADAIRTLQVRGAPLIGIVGAMGVALAAREPRRRLRCRGAEAGGPGGPPARGDAPHGGQPALGHRSHAGGDQPDDARRAPPHRCAAWPRRRRSTTRIARCATRSVSTGLLVVPDGAIVLTHCNAGSLATGGIGTALAPVYRAHQAGRQGARHRRRDAARAPGRSPHRVGAHPRRHSLHADRRQHGARAGSASGDVTCVIVGADRIAANGDTANKIGTYPLALAAKAHDVPFYVAAPQSTFDLATPNGAAIPIEERHADEITMIGGRRDRARGRGGMESGVRRDAGVADHRVHHRSRPADAPVTVDTRARPGHHRIDGAGRARGWPRHRPRLPRVHPVLPASRAGSSTIRSRSSGCRSRRCAKRVAQAGTRPTALGITNQRETVVLWDRRSLRAGGSRHRLAGPAHGRALPRAARGRARADDPAAHRPRLRSLLLRDEARVAAARPGAAGARAERGDIAAGTVESWLVARLTGGLHVSDHTNASRTMLYDLAARGVGRRTAGALLGAARACCRRSCRRPACWATCARSTSASGSRSPGLAGDQQSALFGQGCTRPGMAKNTYGTGAFLLVHAGDTRARPGARPARHRGVWPGGRAGLRARGQRVHRRRGDPVAARRTRGHRHARPRPQALAMSVGDTGGVTFVPAFVGLGTPHWEAEARGTITGHHPRHDARAPRARGGGVDGLRHRRSPARRDGLERARRSPVLRVDGGAAANDFLMQFQADLLGVPVERPGHAGDHRARRRGPGRASPRASGRRWMNSGQATASVASSRSISVAERAARMGAWKRAVHAALAWARYQLLRLAGS